MLPGDAPGRGAPGRAPPGRGACGRGMGRSTGCADENGLLPTRGVRLPGFGPGRGPGIAPGVGPGRAALGGGGACGLSATGPGVADGADAGGACCGGGAGGACCAGSATCGLGSTDGLGPVGFPGFAGAVAASTVAAAAPLPVALATALSEAGLPPPNDSRSRRATGASTVEDADLTNSPCSLSRARTCLLVTPSSLANSCTRALPATTSPVYEATAVVGRASGLAMTHGHRDFTVCSCSLLPVLLPGSSGESRDSQRL
jgi:hypothetical protein